LVAFGCGKIWLGGG